MKINDDVPGLPEWPLIFLDKAQGEYRVEAQHLTYWRFLIARNGTVWLFLLSGILCVVLGFLKWIPENICTILLVTIFVAGLVLSRTPLAGLIGNRLFSTKTIVRISSKHVIVGNKVFDNTKNVQIQFRADRLFLKNSDASYRRIKAKMDSGKIQGHADYEMKFRRVEMIYGSRIVPITSVADEDRAEQFAAALQDVYDMARSLRMDD